MYCGVSSASSGSSDMFTFNSIISVKQNSNYIIEGYVLMGDNPVEYNGSKISLQPIGITPISSTYAELPLAFEEWQYMKTVFNTGNNSTIKIKVVLSDLVNSGGEAIDVYFDDISVKLDIPNETIAFQEGSNRWISEYSFWPERYGYVNNEMYSFLNGTLWKHNASVVYNNFHGDQHPSRINALFNREPNTQKNFTSFAIEGDKVWAASSITTPEGQESFILSGHFEQINKEWWADIKQDINTPNMASTDEALINGDFIQSNILETMLETQASGPVKLRFANLYSNFNERTNK